MNTKKILTIIIMFASILISCKSKTAYEPNKAIKRQTGTSMENVQMETQIVTSDPREGENVLAAPTDIFGYDTEFFWWVSDMCGNNALAARYYYGAPDFYEGREWRQFEVYSHFEVLSSDPCGAQDMGAIYVITWVLTGDIYATCPYYDYWPDDYECETSVPYNKWRVNTTAYFVYVNPQDEDDVAVYTLSDYTDSWYYDDYYPGDKQYKGTAHTPVVDGEGWDMIHQFDFSSVWPLEFDYTNLKLTIEKIDGGSWEAVSEHYFNNITSYNYSKFYYDYDIIHGNTYRSRWDLEIHWENTCPGAAPITETYFSEQQFVDYIITIRSTSAEQSGNAIEGFLYSVCNTPSDCYIKHKMILQKKVAEKYWEEIDTWEASQDLDKQSFETTHLFPINENGYYRIKSYAYEMRGTTVMAEDMKYSGQVYVDNVQQ